MGTGQLCRLKSCGEQEARIPLETSLLSAGPSAASGTTDCSLFWILSHKGKVWPESWLGQTTLSPAVDFLVLVLKCGEQCHRGPQPFIQENSHPPVAGQSPKKYTMRWLTQRLHPECSIRHVQNIVAKMFSMQQ